MWKIYIVTWVSWAWKTTIKNYFDDEYFDELNIYDFDDIWVPEGADEKWRKESTKYWIDRLRKDQLKWVDSILFWQIVPVEIEWIKDDIIFIFLDASWDSIKLRLQKREWDDSVIQDHKNWINHIKESVLHNNWLIVSTDINIQDSAKEIYNIINH